MDPDLIPTLSNYYRQSICTVEARCKVQTKNYLHASQKWKERLRNSEEGRLDLLSQVEELKGDLAKIHAIADVKQREIDTLKTRHQEMDEGEKAQAHALKVQADAYKREMGELRDDTKRRDEELGDLRRDVLERDNDLKEARDQTRSRDKELKGVRDHLRSREGELRKANHWIEKLQAQVQKLESEVMEQHDSLETMKDALADAEERATVRQVQKHATVLPAGWKQTISRPQSLPIEARAQAAPITALVDNDMEDELEDAYLLNAQLVRHDPPTTVSIPEPETDYNEPPSRPAKKTAIAKKEDKVKAKPPKKATKPSVANKENHDTARKATKKRKVSEEFSASPPRSSPPPESPKRKPVKIPNFSMTPFVDKTKKNALSLIPLSPPSAKPASRKGKQDASILLASDAPKKKKKRKLLGGTKTLMDDTPKKPVTKVAMTNFGKDLSPLKRPVSSSALIMKD